MTKGRYIGLAAVTAALTGAATVAGIAWYARARRAPRASAVRGGAQPTTLPVPERKAS